MKFFTEKSSGMRCVKMDKTEAKALLAFASKDKTRETLSSLAVYFDDSAIASTDGHRLVVAQCAGKTELTKTAIVPRSLVEAMVKLVGKGQAIVLREELGNKVSAGVLPDLWLGDEPMEQKASMVQSIAVVDSTYPPLSQVIVSKRDIDAEKAEAADAEAVMRNVTVGIMPNVYGVTGLNTTFLSDLKLVSDAVERMGVQLQINGDLDPIRFDASSVDDVHWFGVIMPMRL